MRSNKISLGGRKTFMMFLILLKPDVLLFGCYCSVIYIYKFQLDFNTTYTSFQTDVCEVHSLPYFDLNVNIWLMLEPRCYFDMLKDFRSFW